MNFPKVLIIGQPFNEITGGGITISNLYHNWPKENLAVTNSGKLIGRNDFTLCNNAYVLGDKEYKIRFPFSLFFKNFRSEEIHRSDKTQNKKVIKKNILGKFKSLAYEVFENIFFFFDLNFYAFRIKVSDEFLEWFNNYKPDIIYTHLGKIEILYFVLELKAKINVPIVIHIMDDWPNKMAWGLFANYWQKKLEINFKKIIEKADLLLCISESMSEEYQERYKKLFHPFHNPIEISKWLPETKTDWKLNKPFQLLYTGRVGYSNSKSVKDLCLASEILRKQGFDILLNLYTPDANKHRAKKLARYKSVRLYSSISHDEVPLLLKQNDLLILPLDFDDFGINYTKLSMPTKASEYMISGTPIIVYAPKQVALTKHAKKYNWAYIVDEQNMKKLTEAITLFIENKAIREQYGKTAHEFSLEHYNAKLVREKFRHTICSILK